MNRRDSSNLLDRHNVAIAKILSCFRNIVTASTASIPEDGNTVEHASSTSFTMQMQTAALISEIEGLLAINRELKSLWMRGPLRQPGEDDGREAVIDAQARSVAHLYDQALAMRDAALNAVVVDRDDARARARADESLSLSGS